MDNPKLGTQDTGRKQIEHRKLKIWAIRISNNPGAFEG